MKPIKVEFLRSPKIKPITEYKRCFLTLWLLKCSYPKYKLLEDMEAVITFDNGEVHFIAVMRGYVCDLASIPRVFWSIYPPDGLYRYAAILHDILYQSEEYKRLVADQVFKVAIHKDVPSSVKELFYKAVRVGGYFVWKTHNLKSLLKAKEYIDRQIIKGEFR